MGLVHDHVLDRTHHHAARVLAVAGQTCSKQCMIGISMCIVLDSIVNLLTAASPAEHKHLNTQQHGSYVMRLSYEQSCQHLSWVQHIRGCAAKQCAGTHCTTQPIAVPVRTRASTSAGCSKSVDASKALCCTTHPIALPVRRRASTSAGCSSASRPRHSATTFLHSSSALLQDTNRSSTCCTCAAMQNSRTQQESEAILDAEQLVCGLVKRQQVTAAL
jgi:hypothetical protein